jgi:transcriptional regulator with XRE-family HTH domain
MKSNPKSVSSIDQFIGTRIRIRRLMVGRSQNALSERIGVTFQQVQKYGKGTNRIGIARLTQIATAFDTRSISSCSARLARSRPNGQRRH